MIVLEIPESVLFHTTAKGLGADNEEDTTLKEGATIKKVGVAVRPPPKFTGIVSMPTTKPPRKRKKSAPPHPSIMKVLKGKR